MTKIRPGWQIFKPKCVAFPFRGHAHIATAHREPLPPFPSKDLARTLFCTLYALQYNSSSQVRVYRIQYTFKHKNITFTNLLLQLGKDWKVGAQWKYIIKCIYLKLMLRHGTLKSWLKCPHFIFCSKWPWPTNLVFYIIPSFLSNCTKWPYLKQSIHQGRKKQGHCVQGDYKHFGNQTHSPSGVFCLGVYYTRDNTDKDCYIRQGRSQYGAFRTSTFIWTPCAQLYSSPPPAFGRIYEWAISQPR